MSAGSERVMLPLIFATIKHAAVNLLRRDPGKMSIPQKMLSAAWDDDYMYKIITQ